MIARSALRLAHQPEAVAVDVVHVRIDAAMLAAIAVMASKLTALGQDGAAGLGGSGVAAAAHAAVSGAVQVPSGHVQHVLPAMPAKIPPSMTSARIPRCGVIVSVGVTRREAVMIQLFSLLCLAVAVAPALAAARRGN